jgi:hypothetical protein
VPMPTEADLDSPRSPAISGGFRHVFPASRCCHRADHQSPLRAPHHLRRVKSMPHPSAMQMLGLPGSTIRRLRRVSFSRSPPSVLRSIRPLPVRVETLTIGPLVPPRESRSVRVVSLHLDGFLRTDGASIVAARSRPWGSPCFPALVHLPRRFPKNSPVSMVDCVSTMHSPLEDAPYQQLHSRSPHLPKMMRSRKSAPSMPFPERHRCRAVLPKGFELHSGVFPPRV